MQATSTREIDSAPRFSGLTQRVQKKTSSTNSRHVCFYSSALQYHHLNFIPLTTILKDILLSHVYFKLSYIFFISYRNFHVRNCERKTLKKNSINQDSFPLIKNDCSFTLLANKSRHIFFAHITSVKKFTNFPVPQGDFL